MPWWKAKKKQTGNQPPAAKSSPVDFVEEGDEDDWEDGKYERGDDDKRIMAILGATDRPPEVTRKTLAVYRVYLLQHLTLPCRVTGREDFPWEERFVFGYGNKREYEQLKKTKPSYEDHFDLLGFEDDPDENNGLLAKICRISDKKVFVIGLDWLDTVTKESPEHELLDDYTTWYVNYRY